MKKKALTQEQIDTGIRIREWAEKNFRRFAAAAEALGITRQTLDYYMKGEVTPHNVMQKKLEKAGADIDYIMTGIRKPEAAEDTRVHPETKSKEEQHELSVTEKLLYEMVKCNAQMIERLTFIENAFIHNVNAKNAMLLQMIEQTADNTDRLAQGHSEQEKQIEMRYNSTNSGN